MIINKILAICPVCDEQTTIDFEHPETVIEPYRNEILLSFTCTKCGEYIEQEALEKE